jgi:hypothetical protein
MHELTDERAIPFSSILLWGFIPRANVQLKTATEVLYMWV